MCCHRVSAAGDPSELACYGRKSNSPPKRFSRAGAKTSYSMRGAIVTAPQAAKGRTRDATLDLVLRILVADDEPFARKVLCEELEMHPGVVVVGQAHNGADALQKITQLRPNLVLLDLDMPGINGLDVLQRIQQWDWAPMVVIVTADQERGEAALQFGAVAYLHKPVRPSRLFRSLDAIQEAVSSGNGGDVQPEP